MECTTTAVLLLLYQVREKTTGYAVHNSPDIAQGFHYVIPGESLLTVLQLYVVYFAHYYQVPAQHPKVNTW